MKTGDQAVQAQQAEMERQRRIREERQNRIFAFRFFIQVGQQADIIILDENIGPCFYEHNLTFEPAFQRNRRGGQGKIDIYEACPKDWEPCPLCQETKESYYVMMLSIIDMRPYNKSDGTTLPYTRRLLPVKASQHGFFHRLYERHGSLRGIQLLMSRDTNQTPSIGTPEYIDRHPEDAILASFGHPPVISQQDQSVVKPENADCYPFEYGRLFRRPTAADLRARYPAQLGNTTTPGSAAANEGDGWAGNDPGQAARPQGQGGGIQATAGARTRSSPAASGGGIQPRANGGQGGGAQTSDLDDEIPF